MTVEAFLLELTNRPQVMTSGLLREADSRITRPESVHPFIIR
ncbi:MAG: hypothetical protein AB1750_01575 [Chloroflexota bacterium]